MKVFVLALLVAIALGGLVGTMLVRDPGYVLIAYADTVVETSLWVALGLLLLLYLAVRSLVYLVHKFTRGQSQMLRWRSARKSSAARSQTVRGLLVMAEGRWEDAEKLLSGAADDVETPLINYLNAARAAHELGEHGKRDGYLKRAHETTPGAKFAVTLTQAEFNIADGRYELALASLLNISARAPRHRAVLSMLATCYEALGDWQALGQILADLKKYKVLSEAELNRIEKAVWQADLRSGSGAAASWRKLPRALRADEALLRDWVRDLIDAQRLDDAETAIQLVLDHHWQQDLALWYGEIAASDPARQLVVAQGWLKERPNDAQVALTVGRLCLRNEKFEQAREAFETSLRIDPSDVVYGELGRLCIALGDERRGIEYLLLSLGQLAELPQPATPIIRSTSAH
jgi:HemY protein